MEGEFTLQTVKQNVHLLVSYLRVKISRFLVGTTAGEMFEIFCEHAEDSYAVKFILILIVINSLLPALAFVAFAILSFIATFMAFFALEGALLIMGACGAVLWFGLIAVLFVLLALCATLIGLCYNHFVIMVLKIQGYYSSPTPHSGVDEDLVVVENDHED